MTFDLFASIHSRDGMMKEEREERGVGFKIGRGSEVTAGSG